VATSFTGLAYGLSYPCGSGFTCTNRAAPPDVQLAVSPNYVVEMVNVIYAVWTKQGALVKLSDLASLWRTGNDYIGDPKILYDGQSDRWFASLLDVTQAAVTVSVSASNDPTGNWYTYSFKAYSGNCPDQPILGINDDKVVVSSNDFIPGTKGCSGSYVGVQYWIINKSQMLSGGSVQYQFTNPDKSLFSVHPVDSLTSTQTEFMVSSTSGPGLILYSVSGVPPNAVVLQQSIPISSLNRPPAAPQPNSATTIDTGNNRVLDASWANGKMWISLEDGCVPSGDSALRACARLVEVNTNTSSVLQDWDVATPGYYYFYPALRADSKGNLFVVFGYSTSSINPSLAVAMQGFADPLNTVRQPIVLVLGSGPEVNATGFCPSYPVCRYGDYFGATNDPSDPGLVWVAGQYGTQNGWSTTIAGVRMPGSQVPLTLSYTTTGGAPSSTPLVMYTSSGVRLTSELSTTPTTYLVDYGTSWNVTNPVGGSNSKERWATDQQSSGVASVAMTTVFVFHHQFDVNFNFNILRGGSGYAHPTVTYSSFGAVKTASANFSDWADNGSPYSFQNPLGGSSTSERWEANSGTSGTVTASGGLTAAYYHQYALTISFQVSGGGSPEKFPNLSSLQFGSKYQANLSDVATLNWLDSAAQWSATNPLPGSDLFERFFSRTQTSGVIGSGETMTITYQHQFFVDISVTAGGSASIGSDWYDSGQSISVTAVSSSGWAFGNWTGKGVGSFSGNASSILVKVGRQISEKAYFFPGMTLSSAGGGVVTVSFASSSETVTGTKTLYLPVGTSVSIAASPSSFLFQFNGWRGSSNSSVSQIVIQLTGPLSFRAEFGYNFVNIGEITGTALVAVIGTSLLFRRRCG